MTLRSSFCLLVRLACALPALATATALANPAPEPSGSAAPAAGGADMVTTGVAKGRDRLDSATSTSALGQADIRRLGARSVGELLRALPGVFPKRPMAKASPTSRSAACRWCRAGASSCSCRKMACR
jgi:outer membrane receptor protein involved in Fe transport